MKTLKSYNKHLKQFSQTNRKTMTKSEELLWHCYLKGDRTGYRFLRQKIMGNYILDFYCDKLLLCIEVDGVSHEEKGREDETRDQVLKNTYGILTIRYSDHDILKHLEAVGIDLLDKIEERRKGLGK